MKKILLFILPSLILYSGFAGCAKDYVTGKSSYNWFKLNDDVGLGKQVLGAQLQSFDRKNVPVDDSKDLETLNRLKTIVKNIAQVSHLPELPYEVHLADSEVVNAWAAPGGKMMVYAGLWDEKKGLVRKDSDDEIASVLAHEMAHATARHVTESLTQNMTIMLAGSVISSAIAAGGSQTGSNLFGQFFSTGYNIYAPSYSRKNEAEADRLGLFYMAKAGYDPRAAVQVWERASQRQGAPYSIYASHPSSGERVKALQAYLPQALEIYYNPEKPYPNLGSGKKASASKPKPRKAAAAPEPAKPLPVPKSDL